MVSKSADLMEHIFFVENYMLKIEIYNMYCEKNCSAT